MFNLLSLLRHSFSLPFLPPGRAALGTKNAPPPKNAQSSVKNFKDKFSEEFDFENKRNYTKQHKKNRQVLKMATTGLQLLGFILGVIAWSGMIATCMSPEWRQNSVGGTALDEHKR